MSISISAVTPPTAISSQGDLSSRAGTTVEARVVRVTDAMARIAIANTLTDVMADAPLVVGETLRLAVSRTPEGVRLAIVGRTPPDGAAGAPPQGLMDIDAPALAPGKAGEASRGSAADPAPREALVTQLVRDNVGRQASLAPFFADLAEAVRQGNLPPRLDEAAARLLAMRPTLGENLTARDVRLAVAQVAQSSPAAGAAGAATAMPELKAALVVFRQVLSTWLASPEAGVATRGTASTPSAAQSQAQSQAQTLAQSQAQATTSAPATSVSATVVPGSERPLANPATPAVATPLVSAPPASAPRDFASASSTPANLAPSRPAATVAPPGTDADIAVPEAAARLANAAASAGSTPVAPLPRHQVVGVTAPMLPQEIQQAAREIARTTAEGKSDALDPVARLIRSETGSPDGEARVVQPAAGNPPPPFRGGAQTPQPVAEPSVTPDMTVVDVGHKLLDEVDGAIARQTLLQVASLPDGTDGAARADAAQPRWNFEIPFATAQGTAVAQFEIAREGKRGEAGEIKPVWQASFTISIEPVGAVHARIVLAGERTSVRLWAERPAAATALRENTGELSRALREAELVPGDILVGEGAPTRTQAAAVIRAGRYLDRAT